MSQPLPWEDDDSAPEPLQPPPPVAPPLPPVVQPPPVPPPVVGDPYPQPDAVTAAESVGGVTSTDIAGQLQKELQTSFEEALPQLQKTFMAYFTQVALARLSGQNINIASPNITAVTSKGRELKVADAKNRSFRTFIQGLGIDIGFALIGILATLSSFDPFSKAGWATLVVLVTKTLIQTLVSYVARMRITPGATIDGEQVKILPAVVPKPGG